VHFGHIPLPPYIHRESEPNDRITYQTIYANQEGSVAAPTAGLHFTREVLERLENKKTEIIKFLLHVGAGTFRPVVTDELNQHQMHAEKVWITRSSIEKIYQESHKNRIVVGTTTTRLLESLYWQGVKWKKDGCVDCRIDIKQWEPYDNLSNDIIPAEESLHIILKNMYARDLEYISGETSLIIAPGYDYQMPDIMITNFHQPRSTLLLLIAAFLGEKWRYAYDYALENDFRFLSYGDSCLFYKNAAR